MIEVGHEIREMPRVTREHLDAVASVIPGNIVPMMKVQITEDNIKQINKLKDRKAPGPDGFKPELFKIMKDSENCINGLKMSQNYILESGEENSNLDTSKTTLPPKIKKPTVKDFRPFVLTNISYKIFMGIIRDEIEEHFIKNDLINVLQAGFTKKRRITDNLYILRYCTENSFKRKQTLFVIAIDFQKAFDSIDRSRLIETMMKFKIDSNVIEIIANIYSHDCTGLFINNNKQAEIEVTSGIRQGCNGSTLLFLLVTYIIIEKLQTEDLGYKDEFFKIAALVFADDGLVFAQSLEETKRTLSILTEVAASCGLKINKQKSNKIEKKYTQK